MAPLTTLFFFIITPHNSVITLQGLPMFPSLLKLSNRFALRVNNSALNWFYLIICNNFRNTVQRTIAENALLRNTSHSTIRVSTAKRACKGRSMTKKCKINSEIREIPFIFEDIALQRRELAMLSSTDYW